MGSRYVKTMLQMKKSLSWPPYWLLCGMIFILGSSLSACSLGAPTAQPVTITFAYPNYDQAFYEGLLAKFKAQQPAITVELHPWQLSTGNRSDVITDVMVVGSDVLSASDPQAALPVSALPLDALIEQESTFNAGDFYPGSMDAFKLEGKTYAIPSGLDP